MELEQQLDELAARDIRLDDGVTIDDLLISFDREAFDDPPFDLLLVVLGMTVEREPFETRICSRAWNFDTERIVGDGDYSDIVRQLLALAGRAPDYFTAIADSLEDDPENAWLEYRLPDGELVHYSVEVNSDWADTMALAHVMADIESDDQHFYSKENGQAMVLYYLADTAAEELNELSDNALARVVADETDEEDKADEEEEEEEDVD
jgi:hypothetical protein